MLLLLQAPLVSLAHDVQADLCQVQISNPGVAFADTTRAELLGRQLTPISMAVGKQVVSLVATCKQPVLMTLFFRGATADSVSYAMGNGGSFTLRAFDAHLDGRAVGLGAVHNHGQLPEIKGEQVALLPGIGAVPVSNDAPVKGTSLSVQIEISAQLSNIASRVADRTTFRGKGSFELLEN